MTGSEWTCARCGMTASFLPGMAELSEPPASWEHVNGVSICLSCLRKLAGEARAEALDDGGSPAQRVRANAEGRIEFELHRDPDRGDTRVARACETNVALVRQVRDRLGAYPSRPA